MFDIVVNGFANRLWILADNCLGRARRGTHRKFEQTVFGSESISSSTLPRAFISEPFHTPLFSKAVVPDIQPGPSSSSVYSANRCVTIVSPPSMTRRDRRETSKKPEPFGYLIESTSNHFFKSLSLLGRQISRVYVATRLSYLVMLEPLHKEN